jgi:hypothetical protein
VPETWAHYQVIQGFQCSVSIKNVPGGPRIPWAEAGDACSVFWRTDRGGPDDWTIVCCDAGFSEWEEFAGSASEFLCELFSGRFGSDLLGFEPIENPEFEAQSGKRTG